MAKVLTVRMIETLKPAAMRREIPDGLVRGLVLVLQPSGSMSWAVRFRTVRRESRKLTIGGYPAVGLKDARELASRALVSVAAGGDPATEKQTARAKPAPNHDRIETVVDLFVDRYARPNTRASSAKEYRRVLQKEVVERWPGRRLSTITRPEIHALLDDVVDRGSPVQANRVLAAVRKLCGWAVERGLIDTSPCVGIKPPTAENSRDRVLTDSELQRIWVAAGSIGYPFGIMVQILMLTGQRRSEVAAMTWAELDLPGRYWTIPKGRAKNGVEHTVPLSPQVIAVLQAVPHVHDRFVFSTTGRTAVSGFGNAKVALDRRLGDPVMPHWSYHDLRRTAATGMAKLGVTLPVIERVLNHISGSFAGIVGVYQRHQFDDEQRAALELWGRHIAELMPTSNDRS